MERALVGMSGGKRKKMMVKMTQRSANALMA